MRLAISVFLALLFAIGCATTQEKKEVKPEKRTEPCKKYYDFGFEYLRNGSYGDAVVNFQRAVECSSQYVDAYLGLAQAYTTMGRLANAESVCVVGRENVPGEPRLSVAEAQVCIEREDYQKAIKLYLEAIALDSLNFDAWFGVGFAYEMTSDTAKAVESYTKAKTLKPEDTKLRFRLGRLLISTGREDEGLAEVKYVVDAQPEDVEARRELAESYMSVSRYKDALQEFRAILKIEPSDLNATLGEGRAQVKLRNYSAAEKAFEKAKSMAPGSPGPLYYMADMYITMRSFSKARRVLDEALALDINDKVPFYVLYGDIYFNTEQYEQCIEMYRKALTDPTYGRYAENQINRANVRIEKKRLEEEGF
jgi:tetratricopeptide (TPR) repeat protein